VKLLGNEHEVLTSMRPEEVQNLIFQWADDKLRYEDIMDKVVALSQSRAADAKPTPMEVD
jgi:hypothetical protein